MQLIIMSASVAMMPGRNCMEDLMSGLASGRVRLQQIEEQSPLHLDERDLVVTCCHRIHIKPPAPAKECACNAWAICLGLHSQ